MKKWLYFIVVSLIFGSCNSVPEGFEPLFNGEDLSGWHAYGGLDHYNGWVISDGVLTYDTTLREESVSTSLVTNEQFTDFELSMDWMIGEMGNSGLMWAVVDDGSYDKPYRTGPEIQILDDTWDDYVNQRGDINRAGALYNLMPPSKVVANGPGEWNHYLLHIDQTNHEGFLEFNGERVLEFDLANEQWDAMIAKSAFYDWPGFGKFKKGHIALQEHGANVAFKNIYIKRLNK